MPFSVFPTLNELEHRGAIYIQIYLCGNWMWILWKENFHSCLYFTPFAATFPAASLHNANNTQKKQSHKFFIWNLRNNRESRRTQNESGISQFQVKLNLSNFSPRVIAMQHPHSSVIAFMRFLFYDGCMMQLQRERDDEGFGASWFSL